MKYLKYFENNGKLSVGDYVLIQEDEQEFIPSYNDFLRTHIGKVVGVEDDYFYVDFFQEEVDNFPNQYYRNQGFPIYFLKYFSKNLENLETKIQADRYNL